MANSFYPKARKRFGQNFLHDEAIINAIVEAISPDDSHLIEIGPGRGALTLPLLQRCSFLDMVELDRDLVPLLAKQFAEYSHLAIHEADALTFDFSSLKQADKRLRVIGNLPYNITTPLLFHLLDYAGMIEDMCFMLQREVVERICAQPGTKQYGRLTIMLQHRCLTEMLFTVPPEAFDPAPKVESAIIYIQPLRQRRGGDVDLNSLNKVVTQAFSQRRKTIANTLKTILTVDDLAAEGIDPSQRPETLSVEAFVALARRYSQREQT